MASSTGRKTLWKKILGGTFYGLFCAAIFVVASGAGWAKTSPLLMRLIQTKLSQNSLTGLVVQKPANPFEGKDQFTVLVLGCDEDWYYGGEQLIRHQARSDMMMVTRFDFANNRISGLTIPRDTLCQVPGYRAQKINGYHLIGGDDLSKQAVETLIPEVQIDRVVTLNYDAFKSMVDVLGGIEVYVPKKMDYDDNRGHLHIHLKPGRQRLDGTQAIGFVRFRHADDDFHRVNRQHDFMLAVKDTMKDHIAALPVILNKAQDLVNHSLSEDEMAALTEFGQKIGNDNIKMATIPVVDVPGTYDLAVNRRELPQMLRKMHFTEDSLQTRVTYRDRS